MSVIIHEKKGNVAYITLNRPEKYNSVTRELALAFQKALDDSNADENIRAICITGSGKAFCAGQDLGEVVDPNGPSLEIIVSEHFNPIITKIRAIEKPVIAAINGVAAGAGANIALACDITVAKSSASFIQAFSMIGLIPDSGGTYFLPRIIGFQKASALTMLGDKISADDAEKMGMIYKVVEDEAFDEFVEKIVNKLADMPTYGLGLTKRALNQSMSNDLTQQLALEDELQSKAGRSYDYKEGVQAFLEKRKPIFIGK